MATKQQPLIRPTSNMKSPWWQAVKAGDSGRGLPSTTNQKSRFISDKSQNYWVSESTK
ncbi:MAG: hypothetical protein MET45_21380 [Nostoc sp. LLA-1]|nr:hypothetical protein [Cyanocohniella sp. LLY]